MNSKSCFYFAAAALVAGFTATPSFAVDVTQVVHSVTTVNGLSVDRFAWYDSKNRPRSVSFKREGAGNPGHGGYIVQMTYQYQLKSNWVDVVMNSEGPNDGFGYFVSHERYHTFADGSEGTIAGRIFGKDDSPLGSGFPVTQKLLYPTTQPHDGQFHGLKISMTYPRYGLKVGKPANGGNDPVLPITASSYQLYNLPVTIYWTFQYGRDYPRVRTLVDLTPLGGPDKTSFDVRGPYGVLVFDNSVNAMVRRVSWGDRYHFAPTASPVTRNTPWTWNAPNAGARYHEIDTGTYEMGLVEPLRYSQSRLAHGYSDARGNTSAAYNGGAGCTSQDNQKMPCDWEWPYQSLQYSWPYDNLNAPTSYKKFAWGSADYYGMSQTSFPVIYDTPNTSQPFNGFPANKMIYYDLCLVVGLTGATPLTKTVASGANPTYNCANYS